MAKKQFLDEAGLSVFLDGVKGLIPQLEAGDNITLTPDEDKPNKITISSTGGGISLSPVSGAAVVFLDFFGVGINFNYKTNDTFPIKW